MWSRTYETHISDEDIDELWKLVDIEPTDKTSKSGDTRVVFYFEEWSILALILCEKFRLLFFCIDMHGAKLVHGKNFPIFPHPFALVERRISVAQTHHDSDDDKEWRKDNECGERKNNIEYPLRDSSPRSETDTVDLDNRDLAKKSYLCVEFRCLKRIRDVTISDAVDASVLENLLEFFRSEIRVHKENFIDFLSTNKLDKLFIFPDVCKGFIQYILDIGISDKIVDIGIDDFFYQIFFMVFDEEEDTSLFEQSSSEESTDDTIHEDSLDNNTHCPYNKSK